MQYIRPEVWKPIDDLELEPVALEVVTDGYQNCCVVAGPGAGKTELLAQRTSFLLQTGSCVSPQRILALSFKKDARNAIGERVERRVDKQLATRFDSLTYDGFAKSIVDRFIFAISADYRPVPGYQVMGNIIDAYELLFKRKADRRAKDALREHFVINISSLPIACNSPLEKRIYEVWQRMLRGNNDAPSYLTFPMISALAEFLIRTNPKIGRALTATYSYVFLDEFQDTTVSSQ